MKTSYASDAKRLGDGRFRGKREKCNPPDALAGFKAGVHDMVLLDVKMRQMDGFELYEKLSRIDDTVKVCFLTTYDKDYFE